MKRFNVRISPSEPHGTVTAPPSKSISHRALISAALAEGKSVITNLAFSEDILATVDALTSLGAEFEKPDASTLIVRGFDGKPRSLGTLDCRESGSTLRFMIPICLLCADEFKLTGSEKLLSRPLGIYERLFSRYRGVENGTLTLSAGEPMGCGDYRVAANISSQFITGLLFALPLCEGDSRIVLEGSFESASYVALTLQTLEKFGVRALLDGNILSVSGGQKYRPCNVKIEGDASNAAFFAAFEHVRVDGLDPDSLQGDMAFKSHFDAIRSHSNVPIDLSDCPDLAPVLFAFASLCGGATFTHTDRLRIKESDRIAAMQEELGKFGAVLEITDGLCGGTVKVLPRELYTPKENLNSHNDHRIAMALSLLCTKFGGVIEDAHAVAKSMPGFWEELSRLGAEIEIIK
ncbi:MAG: 3-phosphoshikimate 1-carboxyvinyltransferase [Eubacteriales bacterium]